MFQSKQWTNTEANIAVPIKWLGKGILVYLFAFILIFFFYHKNAVQWRKMVPNLLGRPLPLNAAEASQITSGEHQLIMLLA